MQLLREKPGGKCVTAESRPRSHILPSLSRFNVGVAVITRRKHLTEGWNVLHSSFHRCVLQEAQEFYPIANDLDHTELTIRGNRLVHARPVACFFEVRNNAAGLRHIRNHCVRTEQRSNIDRIAANDLLPLLRNTSLIEWLIYLLKP